ncbi:bacteriohemerythrin [Dongshaea marina]|uniref:bacteriohemerythrin n=1 Tax=Dongshaea marina TaxID=2047966 RepID=UPI000D3ED103|nr:bacteriohemerythrin [Dongshaea marina]
MAIRWDQKTMGLEIELIDHQHQRLIQIINHLAELLETTEFSSDEISLLLGNIADYSYYHFQTEEHYFDTLGYSGSAGHKAEHRYYIEQYKAFLKNYKRNGGDRQMAEDILKFLSDWWVSHICISDKQYVPLFREHEIK